ncbi:hypothetical protein RHECNPAF_1740053 [Rhizobium etli CNPAF512]|nr:hypothetical protein RHECNPAF_1740053 [Rhizobium etli CNPAF512]
MTNGRRRAGRCIAPKRLRVDQAASAISWTRDLAASMAFSAASGPKARPST